jgi:hypothetical protein
MKGLLDIQPAPPEIMPLTPVSVDIIPTDPVFGGVIIQFPQESVQVCLRGGPPGSQGPPGPPGTSGASGLVPPFTYPGSWRVKSDGTLEFWNPDQSKWHQLLVRGSTGAEYLTIGAAES